MEYFEHSRILVTNFTHIDKKQSKKENKCISFINLQIYLTISGSTLPPSFVSFNRSISLLDS